MNGSIAIGSRRTTPTCAGGRGGGLGRQRRAHEHAVLPVARLGHQRHGVAAAAAEEDRVERHAVRVVPLRRAWCRTARSACSSGEFGWRGQLAVDSGVQSCFFQSVRCAGGSPMPSHQMSPSSVSATLVKIELPLAMVRIAFGLVWKSVPGRDAEEAVLGVDRVEPAVLADADPGDVVADRLDLPARQGRLEHGQVRLAAGRRERRGDVVTTCCSGEVSLAISMCSASQPSSRAFTEAMRSE